MSHQIERCDFIDMLEESATTHRPLAVVLGGQTRFTDKVRDVITEDGEDYVLFQDHGRHAVREIRHCTWTAPREATYNGKL